VDVAATINVVVDAGWCPGGGGRVMAQLYAMIETYGDFITR
jgi:hypothetical protein